VTAHAKMLASLKFLEPIFADACVARRSNVAFGEIEPNFASLARSEGNVAGVAWLG